MFHVWRKGGGTERGKATGERAGTGDREGRIKATLSVIQYVFTPGGRRGILDSLTHGQNNSDGKKKKEELGGWIQSWRSLHKRRALANERTVAVASSSAGSCPLNRQGLA